MFNEFFFFISGSAAVGVSPLESADPEGPASGEGEGTLSNADSKGDSYYRVL